MFIFQWRQLRVRFRTLPQTPELWPFETTTTATKTPQICMFDNEKQYFARFARAIFIFWHFEDVLVLSKTRNDLFCSCVDDVSIWWQIFNFVFLYVPSAGSNSRILRTHFSYITIAETRSYILRWLSRFCRHRVCLSSLFIKHSILHSTTYNKQCNKHTISCFFIFAPSFQGVHYRNAWNNDLPLGDQNDDREKQPTFFDFGL